MTDYLNPSTRVGGVKQIVVAERQTTIPVDDAPYDDEQYVRVNGEWVPYTAPPIIPDTLAPKPPTGLTGSGSMSSSGTRVDYTLSWTAPTQNTDNSPLDDFAYYVLAWRYAGMTSWVTLTTNDTSYILPSLLPVTNIEWQVKARDFSGNDSSWATKTTVGVTDTTPPAAPSSPILGSRLGTIVASWDGLLAGASAPPTDFAYLEVYMSATTGGPWTTVGRLNGTGSVVVGNLTVGETRYFTFVAIDTAGNTSVRSAETSIKTVGVTGPDIEANAITANMITSGELNAALTITGYLLAGNPTGSRVVIDGEGIRQFDDAGNLLTNIPTDPDLPATFEGSVIADSITIKDYMSLQGLANKVARGAVLTLESGTSAPAQAPSVAIGYQTYMPSTWPYEYLYVPVGTHANTDGTDDILGAKTFFDAGKIIGKTGKWWIGPSYNNSAGDSHNKYGGIDSATAVYVGGSERLIINAFYTASAGAVSAWRTTSLDPSVMTNTGTVEPTQKAQLNTTFPSWINYLRLGRVIGPVSGTQYPERLAMAIVNWNSTVVDSSKITLRQYTVTDNATLNAGFTLVSGSEKVVTNPLVTDEELIGVTHGSTDKMGFPGATRFVWLLHGEVNTYAYDGTTLARLPELDFPTPPGATRMNAWGDLATNGFIGFRTTEWGPNNPISKLTNNHWDSTTTSSKWWLSSTNFDSDITGGTHQSPQGPRASLTMKKRAGLIVTVPPYPVRPSPTTTDDPLSAKIYIGRGASDPGRTYMEYAGQTDSPNRSLLVGDFVFPAGTAAVPPPATGDFPASSPAKIVPGATSNWYLVGDGSAKIGGVTVATDGTTSLDVQGIVLGDQTSPTARSTAYKAKASSGANYYTTSTYLSDATTTRWWANVLYENGTEVARYSLSPTGSLEVRTPTDTSSYRADGISSAGMRAIEYRGVAAGAQAIASTTATALTNGGSGTFVAPPSGIVRIDFGGLVQARVDGAWVAVAAQVRTGGTVGVGTVVGAALTTNDAIMNYNFPLTTSTKTKFWSGLTAGATYNVQLFTWTSDATAGANVYRPWTIISPVT